MIDITFLRPVFLWMLPVAALVVALWRWRRTVFVAWTTVPRLTAMRARTSRVRHLPHLLLSTALGLIVVALTDPVLPYTAAQIRSQGLDIMLVLDLSSSMQELMDLDGAARDAAYSTSSSQDGPIRRPRGKTRLDTTKEALSDFISRRRDDRIGFIVFSDNAYVVSPLTFDYEHLLHYVDMIDDEILRGEGMTAIGEGIGLANHVLARQSTGEERNKVIVVFTDGEHNFGRDPLEALADSDQAAFRVHVIGVDLQEEIKRTPEVLRLTESIRRYGGRYYDAGTVSQLRSAYRDIDALEKGVLTNQVYVRNTPIFTWCALPALVLIVLSLGFRTIPYFADYT